jgi:hypothetical protein
MWIRHTFGLRWLHRSTRTHIKPPYTGDAIDDNSEENVIEDVYDAATRGRHNQSEPRYRDTW